MRRNTGYVAKRVRTAADRKVEMALFLARCTDAALARTTFRDVMVCYRMDQRVAESAPLAVQRKRGPRIRGPSEIAIETTLPNGARITCPGVRLVAVPSAAKRTHWAAGRAKHDGLAKGFPALIALAPGKMAFLGLKSAKRQLSESQTEWLEDLHAMGVPCGLFRDADSAIDFLRFQGFSFIDRLGEIQ